jgi:hypothetical protein
MPRGCIRGPWVFTEERVQRIRHLIGTMTCAEIAADVGVSRSSLRDWATRNHVSIPNPEANAPSVYIPSTVARIKELIGHATTKEIAKIIGVTVPSLKGWSRDHKISLAPPPSPSKAAVYNRLRQQAHRLGFRLSMQRGRVSLWISVRDDMSVADARAFMAHKNRKHRFKVSEDAFLRGGPSMVSLPKMKVRRAA